MSELEKTLRPADGRELRLRFDAGGAELGRGLRPVHGPGRHLRPVEFEADERARRAVPADGRVHDDAVGVELRVLVPARRVVEPGDDEAGRVVDVSAAAAAGERGRLFQVAERRLHPFEVRPLDGGPEFGRPDRPRDAPALRQGEGEVPGGLPVLAVRVLDELPPVRHPAGEKVPERLVLDPPGEPELLGPAAARLNAQHRCLPAEGNFLGGGEERPPGGEQGLGVRVVPPGSRREERHQQVVEGQVAGRHPAGVPRLVLPIRRPEPADKSFAGRVRVEEDLHGREVVRDGGHQPAAREPLRPHLLGRVAHVEERRGHPPGVPLGRLDPHLDAVGPGAGGVLLDRLAAEEEVIDPPGRELPEEEVEDRVREVVGAAAERALAVPGGCPAGEETRQVFLVSRCVAPHPLRQ